MWDQTKKLFSKSYIRTTIILCYLQFGALAFGVGMLLFYPKILQGNTKFMEERPDDNSLTICEIVDYNKFNFNSNSSNSECLKKMPFSSFGYPLITESLYMVGFLSIGILVKYFSMWTLSSKDGFAF